MSKSTELSKNEFVTVEEFARKLISAHFTIHRYLKNIGKMLMRSQSSARGEHVLVSPLWPLFFTLLSSTVMLFLRIFQSTFTFP